MKRTLCLGAVVTLVFAFFAAGAQAGNGPGPGPFYPVILFRLFDRPDLLNFDPFRATGASAGTESFTFTSMGVQYTTSLASYSEYGFDCFSDPDPDKMLDENVLCVRAGHRRIGFPQVYAVEYALSYLYSYFGSYIPYSWYQYGQGLATGFFDGMFGSEVYLDGSFHVMTTEGGELFARYRAEIPDKLHRKENRIKFLQRAFVDVSAFVTHPEGGVLGGFDSWFETCKLKASVKGVAAPIVSPLVPAAKQGTLDRVKSKLDCDQDAVDAMVTKLEDSAGEDAATATSIFRAALAKLDKEDRLELKIKDKDGTEIFSVFGDDDDVIVVRPSL